MAEKTSIAWTDHTFNPWIGCTKIGPGCDHCYAEVRDARRQWDGGNVHWGTGVPRYRTSDSNWKDVLKWHSKAVAAGVRRRVFCASLADVFDNEVPEQWRKDLWMLVINTPNLSWLLVTKRIGNVANMVPAWWMKATFPQNVRLLITICNQEEADRDIPKLLALPCKNGISYEPALGPVDWTRISLGKAPMQVGATEFRDTEFTINALKGAHSLAWPGLGWIICGGESTQGAGRARPFDVGWARRTIAQCKTAGVPVFVKQVGSRPYCEPTPPDGAHDTGSEWSSIKHRAGADPAEWPEDLRVQEFPT